MHIDELRRRLFRDLNGKSDRDCVILAVSWIDHFLVRRCTESAGQHAKVPATLAQRIDAAWRASWIDDELRGDLHVLRKVRNEFAHSIETSSLSDTHLQAALRRLRVPAREYSDWDALRIAATKQGGIVLYAGAAPPEATDRLNEGPVRFRFGLSVILVVLLVSLKLEFASDDPDEAIVLTTLPRLMGRPENGGSS